MSEILLLVCSSSRVWMMAAVLQLSVVRSILFFVTLVLWTDEQYNYGDVSRFFTALPASDVQTCCNILCLIFYSEEDHALLQGSQ